MEIGPPTRYEMLAGAANAAEENLSGLVREHADAETIAEAYDLLKRIESDIKSYEQVFLLEYRILVGHGLSAEEAEKEVAADA